MARRKWIFDRQTQKMVEVPVDYVGAQIPKSPTVIQDSMDATMHPATGKMMDSKSEFRKVTRAAGCVEIGNEQIVDRVQRSTPIEEVRESIRRAVNERPSHVPVESINDWLRDIGEK